MSGDRPRTCPERLWTLRDASVTSVARTWYVAGPSGALPAARRALVRAAEEDERGAEQDQEVGLRARVVDVPEVVLDPLRPGEAGAAVDLRPAGQAGPPLEAAPLAIVVLLH